MMTANTPFPLKDQREKQKFVIEVANTENQLWAMIYSKGILHSDAQDLYRKVRSSYENLLLSDQEQLELQDIEYSLWKLHYKHIDEFRKRIKRSSANADSKSLAVPQKDNHIEGIQLFLSEAIEFYQNLIVTIRECNRLPEDSVFYRKGGNLTFAEQKKMQKCQFLCHRILVCLGDLARYREQYEKPDVQNRDWSVAATYYLEATVIWPDSGNPHNQLAVLAIYIGDEFLALYHCIRSLAVKEPFPDAQDNLILLFERSRSSNLYSQSSDADFNFLDPSERSSVQTISHLGDDKKLKAEHNCYVDRETKLWSLIIGTLSFFHIQSSVDEFPCAFAPTMRELDALMALDDTKLKAILESYERMDSVKRGPFRALQVVSVLIFSIQNLIKKPDVKEWRDKNDVQQKELTQLALTATFIFMGRFVERCLKAGAIDICPLLPAVLVFVEWLVVMLDGAEKYGADEKSKSAMSYFFGAFVEILKQFNVSEGEANYPEGTPLWEDYELRGFAPVACVHASLDFSSHCEHIGNYESGIDFRKHRIINAAIKIADRPTGSQKWIVYDKPGRKFCKVYITEPNEYPDGKVLGRVESNNFDVNLKVPSQHIHGSLEESEKQMIAGEDPSSNGQSVAMEEEEVILFRPLTRHNSAPLKIYSTLNDPTSTKDTGDQSVPSDECLRRATSLLIAQNQSQSYPLSFHADSTNFRRNMSYELQEPVLKDTLAQSFSETPITAGPPSLSAWVLDGGNLSNNREKSTSGISKHDLRLSPIEEIASEYLEGLSISKNEDAITSQSSSSTYTTPVPSAPLLPDDAVWFNDGIQCNFIDCKSSEGISITDNVFDVSHSPASSYSNWAATQGPPEYGLSTPSFMDKYPPGHRMTSSEWLRQYRESLNLQHHARPNYLYPSGNYGNLCDYDTSRFPNFNPWNNPVASNPAMLMNIPALHLASPLDYGDADGQKREKLFPGYQRTSPYGCGALTDLRNEQQPLLQYLKERERQLQPDPTTARSPTYLGN